MHYELDVVMHFSLLYHDRALQEDIMEDDHMVTVKIIDLLDNGKKFSQFKDRLIIYKDEEIPLGIAVNYEDFNPANDHPPGIDVFLALKAKYGDYVNVYIKVGFKVYRPNAKTNMWVLTKAPKQMWMHIKNTGVSFDQLKSEFKKEKDDGRKGA